MSIEDDEWALARLKDSDDRDSSFGIGTYRWRDEHNVVHRATWARKARGWASLCGVKVPRADVNDDTDPGAVTCIQCIAEDIEHDSLRL